MGLLRNLFTDHPDSVGESYGQHAGHAFYFAGRLALATLACTVHAIVPGLCKTTGSGIIRDLHDKMVANRTGAWRDGQPDNAPALAE